MNSSTGTKTRSTGVVLARICNLKGKLFLLKMRAAGRVQNALTKNHNYCLKFTVFYVNIVLTIFKILERRRIRDLSLALVKQSSS